MGFGAHGMYVLIDTRAVLDSSGKPFVVRRALRLPLWSGSLSPGSSLAEVFLSMLLLGVWANNRRWSGARARRIFKVDRILPSGPTGMDPSQAGASEIALDLTTRDGASLSFRRWNSTSLSTPMRSHRASPMVSPWSAQQFSMLLFQTRKNRSRTSGFLTSVPRAMFPATLRSSLQKGAWHGPTVSRMIRTTTGGVGGSHSFWTN